MRIVEFSLVYDALYTWFLEQRNRHTPTFSDLIKAKAKVFYKEITKKDEFCTSNSWFDLFKNRFGIHLLAQIDEKLFCNFNAVESYKEKFLKTLNELLLQL